MDALEGEKLVQSANIDLISSPSEDGMQADGTVRNQLEHMGYL